MKSYRLERDIPIEDGYDLLVAGGGPAGSTAAVCAARLGLKVLLVEATGCLGGMGTSGLVAAWNPMADGEKMIVGGFMRELVETMHERGFIKPGLHPDTWRKEFMEWTHFNPEGLKLVLDEKAVQAGVEVRFFTRAIDAEADPESGRVEGVIIHNIEGYSYVKASAFIDATGDAVLAALCGAAYREAGRDTANIMPATLMSLFAGIDYGEEVIHTQNPRVVELIEKEYAAGNFTQCDRHLVGMGRIGGSTGCLNGGHIFGLNAVKVRDMTEGMMLGRRIARENERFYRKYSPNCGDLELTATAALMGVRESRRIVGEYELDYADYKARRQFPDQIGVYNNFVDIHPYDCSREEYDRMRRESFDTDRIEPGECYGLPYGMIVPRGWSNLWVAGRCNSSDVKVHGAVRVMPSCAMMGQAAGTAAAQSLHTRQPACDLDTAALVETLRARGAWLPQAALSSEMTRKPCKRGEKAGV